MSANQIVGRVHKSVAGVTHVALNSEGVQLPDGAALYGEIQLSAPAPGSRSEIAAKAMAAILSNPTMVDSFGGATYAWIADHACGVADALLARLDQ